VEHIGSNINGLALDLVGPTTVVSEAANNGTDITTGVGDGLSVVERLNSGEKVEVLLSEIGELEEEVASDLGRSGSPLALLSIGVSVTLIALHRTSTTPSTIPIIPYRML
jgi:hypothetical protein